MIAFRILAMSPAKRAVFTTQKVEMTFHKRKAWKAYFQTIHFCVVVEDLLISCSIQMSGTHATKISGVKGDGGKAAAKRSPESVAAISNF